MREIVEEFYSVEERLISVATIQSALGFIFDNRFRSQRGSESPAPSCRSLAAPMYIVEERTVGAQLGDENRSGWYSVIGGFSVSCFLWFLL